MEWKDLQFFLSLIIFFVLFRFCTLLQQAPNTPFKVLSSAGNLQLVHGKIVNIHCAPPRYSLIIVSEAAVSRLLVLFSRVL